MLRFVPFFAKRKLLRHRNLIFKKAVRFRRIPPKRTFIGRKTINVTKKHEEQAKSIARKPHKVVNFVNKKIVNVAKKSHEAQKKAKTYTAFASPIGGFFGSLLDRVTKAVNNVVKIGKEALFTAGKSVWASISQTTKSVTDTVMAIGSKTTETVNAVGETVKKSISHAFSVVSTGTRNVGNWLSKTVNSDAMRMMGAVMIGGLSPLAPAFEFGRIVGKRIAPGFEMIFSLMGGFLGLMLMFMMLNLLISFLKTIR